MNSYIQSTLISIITLLLLTPMAMIAQDNNRSIIRNADGQNLEWGSCPEFMPDSCEIAVLQGDPANPNVDLFFKLQGNTTVPEHWHHSAERMILVSGNMEVNYEGQSPAVITAGTYAYGPPEKPHTASCLSDEPCILFIAFNKPVDAFPVE
ncbi:MAG: cupin domain-containing protein [Balneolaceae bacterium]|nr:cupin domain-containing protein [Balneolaceae bacterium]